MNPEFKRNIWLEFSTQRLIAMPTVLLAIFFVVYLKYDFSTIPSFGLLILFLLLVVWGSGLAADAVFEEIQAHTWNAQRMTPLGPWAMAWGKLFGSTIFVWYGAFWCLAAIWFSANRVSGVELGNDSSILQTSLYYLGVGTFTQAFALFIALLFQRISPLRSRSKVVLIQLFAIVIGSILFNLGLRPLANHLKVHLWYNLNISYESFVLGSAIFFCGSLLFGIYRLLRAELQMRSFPWGWPLFLMVWIGYLLGFVAAKDKEVAKVVYAAIAYFMLLKGTFLSAFFTQKNIIQYFRWVSCLKEFNVKRSLTLTPPWVITLVFALLFVFPLLYVLSQLDFSSLQAEQNIVSQLDFSEFNAGRKMLMAFGVSLFFFLLRDLGLLYYLTFNFQAKRAHLATLVYLAALYTLLPMLLSFTGLSSHWFPAIAPWEWLIQTETMNLDQIIAVIFLVLTQAIASWGGVVFRWREAAKQLA